MKNKAVGQYGNHLAAQGLAACWFQFKGDTMEYELAPEKAMELGKRFEDLMISSIPLDKFEIDRGEINYLVYCTQTPDTSIPNTYTNGSDCRKTWDASITTRDAPSACGPL